jgi:pterin-4a-carbinolamine dehydratase
MEVNVISPGAIWPDRIRRALDDATVMLSVIGPDWLKAADQYGRRRLDQPDDWVRNEIVHALSSSKTIIPVLVAGADRIPPIEGLPNELHGLLKHEAIELRDDKWEEDLSQLVRTLVSEHKFIENQKSVPLPQPEITLEPLTEPQLDAALDTLVGWQPVESMIPGDYPNYRRELRKAYRFKSFKGAIDFMKAAVPVINKTQHHPRWENQWRSVTVYLSTWDVGYKISELDISLARAIDSLYDELNTKPRNT